MGIGVLLITFLVILYTCYYFSKGQRNARRIARLINVLPGDRKFPIIGTAWRTMSCTREELFDRLNERNIKYGPIFRSWLGSIPTIHLTKAEHIEVLVKSPVHINKGQSYFCVKPWLGEGLISSSGHHWSRNRKFLTPTFHFKILDSFVDIFSEKSRDLVKHLTPKADGKFFDIYPLINLCALDVICETAMGIKINAMENSDSEYVQAIYGLLNCVIHRMFHPLLHSDFIFNLSKQGKEHNKHLKILHAFTDKIIQDKKSQIEQNVETDQVSEEDELLGKKNRYAFLELLIRAIQKGEIDLTDEELRQEVDTFTFTGHDSTTLTACWTLFSIGNYPEVQQKVHEELDGIFFGEERPITPEDLIKMTYLERVIKESLRVHPLVASIARTLTQDMILDGKIIPAGVMVVIHLSNLHMDPTNFPDPKRFDPDRFLPENAAQRHPYSFIPFSAGPRNCIGQKYAMRDTKTMISTILRKFSIKSFNTPENIKYYPEVVTRPQNGMIVSLQPRTPST